MEWITAIRTAIDFMEEHLTDDISAQDVADSVYVSPFFLQKGFSLMTGCGIGEYLRSRRLYKAALDLRGSDEKITDIAMRYCYDTSESFAKAFSRFHGASPSQVRAGAPFRVFLPLKISINIQGGNTMDHKITPMRSFRVIGFQREFDNVTAYTEIPKFWDGFKEKYHSVLFSGKAPENAFEQAIADNGIGEYGVCIDDISSEKFRYLIAGKYMGGEIPDSMVLYEFPDCDWAVFECKGPMPDALQSVNTRIFGEWLPGNREYELCGSASIEWYDESRDTSDSGYSSAVWIPVKRKA